MARRTSSVTGKVVAITGGARGIGKAVAEAFLADGAAVAIGDIDAELVAKTAAELSARPGARVIGLPLDVTDATSFAAFLDEAEGTLGPLNILVNNAGIMPTGPFLDEAPEMTARQIDINVYGVVIGSRLAARRFAARGDGHIVNIASVAGITGEPGLATYCGTKHFVVGFTESLHLELKPSGVGVSTVLPGVVRTELGAGAKLPAWMEGLATVDPEDVARGVIAAVAKRKSIVFVPVVLGGALKSMSVMPSRARFAVLRALRLDVMITEVDQHVRQAYTRRISEGL